MILVVFLINERKKERKRERKKREREGRRKEERKKKERRGRREKSEKEKKKKNGNSLADQGLRLCTFIAKGVDSLPGRGTKTPQVTQFNQ